MDFVRGKIQALLDGLIVKEDHEIFLKQVIPSLGDAPANLMKSHDGIKRVLEHLEAMESGGFV